MDIWIMTENKKGLLLTHAIANKGFSGMRSSSPASNFISVDKSAATHSFTVHNAIVLNNSSHAFKIIIPAK